MKARAVIATAIGSVASVAAGAGTYGMVNLGACEATGNCRISSGVVLVAFIGGSAVAGIAIVAGGGLRLPAVLVAALAAGAFATAASGNQLGWLLGGIFLLVGFGTLAVAAHTRRMTRRAGARMRALMRAAVEATQDTLTGPGLPATGTVLSVTDTGTTVNDDPLATLRLRVAPADGSAAFEAVVTRLVPRLAAPRPGDRFVVEYDPADPTRLAVRAALPAEPGHGSLVDQPADQRATLGKPPSNGITCA
ncbi:hypothetical protein ACFFX1_21280 [Dactylosporangium sucinum]|uniref:Uncharacterized protein n=1 Tax=Dactylosporangium sucinum TaxID=1424081 RepID=A0A917UCV5_9ACTN|nr:hypothetical protein [Dactylosporangium sucinum]GGM82081.1 hypothetical protein GCM10007977_099400 [Dactylosporangium sucinum]